MARQFVEREKTQKVQELEKVTCDWCGCEIKLFDEDMHIEREYRVTVTSVYFVHEVAMDVWGIDDLCADCVQKLRALVKEAGIKTTTYDY